MRSIFFLFTTVIFLLTGCGDSIGGETGSKNEEQINDKVTISTQASYIGLMDQHTIEVIIDNEPLALQINEEQMSLLEPLKTNKQIYIEYYYNEETSQNILEKVVINQ